MEEWASKQDWQHTDCAFSCMSTYRLTPTLGVVRKPFQRRENTGLSSESEGDVLYGFTILCITEEYCQAV